MYLATKDILTCSTFTTVKLWDKNKR